MLQTKLSCVYNITNTNYKVAQTQESNLKKKKHMFDHYIGT